MKPLSREDKKEADRIEKELQRALEEMQKAEEPAPKVVEEEVKPQVVQAPQCSNKYSKMGFAPDASELLQELDESWQPAVLYAKFRERITDHLKSKQMLDKLEALTR